MLPGIRNRLCVGSLLRARDLSYLIRRLLRDIQRYSYGPPKFLSHSNSCLNNDDRGRKRCESKCLCVRACQAHETLTVQPQPVSESLTVKSNSGVVVLHHARGRSNVGGAGTLGEVLKYELVIFHPHAVGALAFPDLCLVMN